MEMPAIYKKHIREGLMTTDEAERKVQEWENKNRKWGEPLLEDPDDMRDEEEEK